MMPMTKQRLDIPLKLKSVSDSGEFEGYGSVFGVKDSFDDVVVPGAFSKCEITIIDEKFIFPLEFMMLATGANIDIE